MCDSIINEHVSIREAAILTGMCAQTLRKLGDQQKIKCYKTHSGQRKFDKASLIEMVKSNITLSNIVNEASVTKNIKTLDEHNDNDIDGNPGNQNMNKEYFYYDICKYKIEKKNIDDFISKNPSIAVINDIDKIIDTCLESKNIKIYILSSLFNNTNEYAMLKRICNKYDNKLIII
jgi:hypothetical protein